MDFFKQTKKFFLVIHTLIIGSQGEIPLLIALFHGQKLLLNLPIEQLKQFY